MTYDEAVRIIKGEQDVNGQNSIKLLEAELEAAQKTVLHEIDADIADREAQINAGGMKKGQINFFTAKINELKQEKSDVEEDLTKHTSMVEQRS